MVSFINKIKDIVSGDRIDSEGNHNGKQDASNLNGKSVNNENKKAPAGDDINFSAPLIDKNTESLKEPDFWRSLGEQYGINGSGYEETKNYVEKVSEYMAERVEQEQARKVKVENILIKNNNTKIITGKGRSHDTIISSKNISSDNKLKTEDENDKNKYKSSDVDDAVESISHAENDHDEENARRIKEKIQKYEQRLDEIRDLKSRMVRSYWNGLTDELNHLLYKIFHSLQNEVKFPFDGHQNKKSPLSNDKESTFHIDKNEKKGDEEYSKDNNVENIVDTFGNVYEKIDKIRKEIKDEEEIDGYAFYKTRLMIFLMIVGLFFGVFVELAFMSKYTGNVLETGSFYEVLGNYQIELIHAIETATQNTVRNGRISRGGIDWVMLLLNFPVRYFVEAHFVFFFSLLPFVFGFVIKIWLDQINQKEKSDKEKKDDKSSELIGENQGRYKLIKALRGAWRPLKFISVNDRVTYVFIVIIVLYTVALGRIVAIKYYPDLGFYAAMLSLGLMISMGLIMHNLVKTYSRYKTISKRGFLKRYSLEYSLDSEYKEVSKILESIKNEKRNKDNKYNEKKREEENDGKMGRNNGIKGSGVVFDDFNVIEDEQTDEKTEGGNVGSSDRMEKNVGSSNSLTKDSADNGDMKKDAESRVKKYAESCAGAFMAGYEYGTKEYLEKHAIEEIVETQYKYDKFKELFGDKKNNNTGGSNGRYYENS
jgi:hypothetical protein